MWRIIAQSSIHHKCTRQEEHVLTVLLEASILATFISIIVIVSSLSFAIIALYETPLWYELHIVLKIGYTSMYVPTVRYTVVAV